LQGLLEALRGDPGIALDTLATLPGLLASEGAQDQAQVDIVRVFTSVPVGQRAETLGHARAVLARADVLGISHDTMLWAWPAAARAAHDLADTAAIGELLAQLDAAQPGHLAPMLRAERELVCARRSARDEAAAAALTAAIRGPARARPIISRTTSLITPSTSPASTPAPPKPPPLSPARSPPGYAAGRCSTGSTP